MYYFLIALILFTMFTAIFIGISCLISIYGGAQYVDSGAEIYESAFKLAELKSGEEYFELGSGYGKGLLIAANHYQAHATGLEISPFHYFISKIKTHKIKNIKVVFADYRNISLRRAMVVYCYLLPKQFEILSKKFRNELPKGARVVSYEFNIPKKVPLKIIHTKKGNLFLYKY